MATKVAHDSSAEPQSLQSSVAMSTNSVSASGPRVSKFGSKAGFVIPKNKLSGSLIPIFRSGGKVEAGITHKEEGTKHIQRKTKWGPDLTQDAAVRKGRALAYQTRVEQITQQLKSGILESGDDHDLQSPTRVSNHDSGINQLDAEPQKHDLLDLERRELIGEILLLNPSYKAPSDFKPLLKEDKVPIPFFVWTDLIHLSRLVDLLKTYPGFNFIGLILGPDNDTQKRLEKETGAKVRVIGTKAGTGEKREITHSDINDSKASYEDVYVHVSADTYDKVDAAVSLIELLFAPASANAVVASTTISTAVGDSGSISDIRQDSTSGYTMISMGAVVVPVQPGPQQFHAYTGPWCPPRAPNVPLRPPSGFMPPPMPNYSLQFPPSPGNPMYAQPFFGGHPGSVPRNPSAPFFRYQPPMQVLQRPLNQVSPSNLSMPSQQASSTHPTMPPQPISTPPQTMPLGMMSTGQSNIQNQQSGAIALGGLPPNRPLSAPFPLRNPWPSVPSSAPQSQMPSSMMQMASNQSMGTLRPHLTVMQNNMASVSSSPNFPAPSISRPPATSFGPPAAFPSQSSTVETAYSSCLPQASGPSLPAMVPYSVKPLAPSISGPTFLPSIVPSPVRPLPVSAPSGLPVAFQTPALVSTSAPVSGQASVPPQSVPLTIARPSVPVPSMALGASIRAPSPVRPPQPAPAMPGSAFGGLPSFSPMKQPSANPVGIPSAPKPQPPSSGNFTFQRLGAQTSLPLTSSVIHTTSQVPLAAPQAPSFRPAVQHTAILAGGQNYLRPQPSSQMGPPQALIPPPSPASAIPHPINSPTVGPPSRHTPFPNPQHVSPLVQANPPSFVPANQAPNFTSLVPVRPPAFMQPLNQVRPSQPRGLLGPSQQLSNNHPSYVANKLDSSPGGNQSYDPFSPTSISFAPPQQAGDQSKVKTLETDAEYEDLMASVGVR